MGEVTEGEILMLILGGLYDRHATWNFGANSAFAIRTEENQEKP